MNLTDILSQAGGISSIARELGISEGEAESGASALLPAILGGMKKQAQAGGIEGLGGLLGQLGGGGLFDNVLSKEPTDVSRGNDVLGEIFGSKDVSRTVANNAAETSGLAPSILKKMLPMLAMLAAGYFAKHREAAAAPPTQGGGLGGLGDLLGNLRGQAGGGGGLGGLASMLDVDGNGNPLDDIMRMAGKVMKR